MRPSSVSQRALPAAAHTESTSAHSTRPRTKVKPPARPGKFRAQRAGSALVLALSFSGCLARAKPVTLPSGETVFRVECHYERANCLREARSACHGPYEIIGDGDSSCEDCGLHLDDDNEGPSSVMKNVVEVRCKR